MWCSHLRGQGRGCAVGSFSRHRTGACYSRCSGAPSATSRHSAETLRKWCSHLRGQGRGCAVISFSPHRTGACYSRCSGFPSATSRHFAGILRKESKCLLCTFFCLALIPFVLVGAGAIAGFVMDSESILAKIRTGLQESINGYNETEATHKSWDFFQDNFECCGVDGSEDWAKVLGPNNVPRSCCMKDSEGACSAGSNYYDDGCVEKLEDLVEGYSKLFGYIAIAAAIFLLISMIVSCVIIKSFSR